MVPDAIPDYCPFCGAQLGEEPRGFDDHLAERDDCAERFDAWREPARAEKRAASGGERTSLAHRIFTWLLVVLIVAYSLLIARRLLLGIVAAALVYIASLLVRRPIFAG